MLRELHVAVPFLCPALFALPVAAHALRDVYRPGDESLVSGVRAPAAGRGHAERC